ncbi:hypothetical protein [Candidatus Hecatella orcuttiae]|jgi:hypothetical protein|uniref:hypothetical protein n=1 Tax=Candidatus Hecatella orcuttiae TaxID=1935119 RepID=UPI0028680C21|nr:hypothetical protein [Candidatus Hecatella orcuttiae]
MAEKPSLKVHVELGEAKLDLEGSPEEVIKAFLQLVGRVYPAYRLVEGLTLTVDLEGLMKNLEGILAFTAEGPVILIPKDRLGRLSIRELIALHLTKAYVGNQVGRLERVSLSVDELLQAIGGRIGAMAGRLSEMVDEGLVVRIGRGEYKITTYGLKHFQENILPKLRQLKEA